MRSTSGVRSSTRVIGLTLGDAAGIGPEVVSAALQSGKLDQAFEYRLLGDRGRASPGEPTRESARDALEALEEAARAAIAGKIAAVVTGPVSKARLQSVGFTYPGQTEFFAARAGIENFAMCLTGGALTVALVTAHVPLREVPALLELNEIVRVGQLLAGFLTARLNRAPRVAVAGLNPHAGESGTLGREEIELIGPAVEKLNDLSSSTAHSPCSFSGPISPDTVFYRALRGEFDGVLCMYHDQGLIPLKLAAFDEGVNVTLGLPFPRTSPDHGTAFEIAGKGIARAESMIAAINLAAELAWKH
ncbi:MAG: 4-hydroxythreonine-4-phosphate dehydrogenase PdxA [Verrucomicrobiota bacterium]|nr:4-hydroxythreonine-4-phosphate dehydrogenase PdxA [Verrucomicrobiota bacterium]